MKKKKTTGEYQEDMRGREDEDILNAREEEAAPTEDIEEMDEEEGQTRAGGRQAATREPEFPKKHEPKTGGKGRRQRGDSNEEEMAA
jgi:hypothetical protein